jgi:ER lumen protein retaining receptor
MHSLVMQCFVYTLRLSSSTWLKGYIPIDATGDGLYQGLDIASLGLAGYLIYSCMIKYRQSYQGWHDTCEIELLVMLCCALAVMVHPDLNDRPLFDTAWAASLYIDSVAMLPQVWIRNSHTHCQGAFCLGTKTAANFRAHKKAQICWALFFVLRRPRGAGMQHNKFSKNA